MSNQKKNKRTTQYRSPKTGRYIPNAVGCQMSPGEVTRCSVPSPGNGKGRKSTPKKIATVRLQDPTTKKFICWAKAWGKPAVDFEIVIISLLPNGVTVPASPRFRDLRTGWFISSDDALKLPASCVGLEAIPGAGHGLGRNPKKRTILRQVKSETKIVAFPLPAVILTPATEVIVPPLVATQQRDRQLFLNGLVCFSNWNGIPFSELINGDVLTIRGNLVSDGDLTAADVTLGGSAILSDHNNSPKRLIDKLLSRGAFLSTVAVAIVSIHTGLDPMTTIWLISQTKQVMQPTTRKWMGDKLCSGWNWIRNGLRSIWGWVVDKVSSSDSAVACA